MRRVTLQPLPLEQLQGGHSKDEVGSTGTSTSQAGNKWLRYSISTSGSYVPSAMEGSSLVRVGEECFLFGGFGQGRGRCNAHDRLHLPTMQWYPVLPRGEVPEPRSGHAAAVLGRDVLVCGGEGATATLKMKSGARISHVVLGDVHRFCVDDQSWERISTSGDAPRRRGHSLNVLPTWLFEDRQPRALLFGGSGPEPESGADVDFNELFVLHTKEWRWEQLPLIGTPPSPRAGHTATTMSQSLLVFGGASGRKMGNDVFALNARTLVWTKVLIEESFGAPPCLSGHCAVVHPEFDAQLLVFGGMTYDGKLSSDVYSLDIEVGEWTRESASGRKPAPRYDFLSFVWDGFLCVFGGCTRQAGKSAYCNADVYMIKVQASETPENSPRSSQTYNQLLKAGIVLPDLAREIENWKKNRLVSRRTRRSTRRSQQSQEAEGRAGSMSAVAKAVEELGSIREAIPRNYEDFRAKVGAAHAAHSRSKTAPDVPLPSVRSSVVTGLSEDEAAVGEDAPPARKPGTPAASPVASTRGRPATVQAPPAAGVARVRARTAAGGARQRSPHRFPHATGAGWWTPPWPKARGGRGPVSEEHLRRRRNRSKGLESDAPTPVERATSRRRRQRLLLLESMPRELAEDAGLTVQGGASSSVQSRSSLGRRSDGADGLLASLRQARSEASLSSDEDKSEPGFDSGHEAGGAAVADAAVAEGVVDGDAAGGTASDVMVTGGTHEGSDEEEKEGEEEESATPAAPPTAGRAHSLLSASAELSAIQSPDLNRVSLLKRAGTAVSSYPRRQQDPGGPRPATSFGALPSPIVLRSRSTAAVRGVPETDATQLMSTLDGGRAEAKAEEEQARAPYRATRALKQRSAARDRRREYLQRTSAREQAKLRKAAKLRETMKYGGRKPEEGEGEGEKEAGSSSPSSSPNGDDSGRARRPKRDQRQRLIGSQYVEPRPEVLPAPDYPRDHPLAETLPALGGPEVALMPDSPEKEPPASSPPPADERKRPFLRKGGGRPDHRARREGPTAPPLLHSLPVSMSRSPMASEMQRQRTKALADQRRSKGEGEHREVVSRPRHRITAPARIHYRLDEATSAGLARRAEAESRRSPREAAREELASRESTLRRRLLRTRRAVDSEKEGRRPEPSPSPSSPSLHTQAAWQGGDGDMASPLPRVHSVRGSERGGGQGPDAAPRSRRADVTTGRHSVRSVRSTSTASVHTRPKAAKDVVLEAQSPEERRQAILQQQEQEQRRTLIRKYSQAVIHREHLRRASHSTPFK